MSHFLDRLKFLSRVRSSFSEGHGAVVKEDRAWENAYRSRWQHDKIVMSGRATNHANTHSASISTLKTDNDADHELETS